MFVRDAGLDAELPQQVQRVHEVPSHQIVAEYTADHQLAVNKTVVSMADAERTFRELFATRSDKTLYVIGDGSVRYGEIMAVIDAAVGAGVTRVGVVTEAMIREGK